MPWSGNASLRTWRALLALQRWLLVRALFMQFPANLNLLSVCCAVNGQLVSVTPPEAVPEPQLPLQQGGIEKGGQGKESVLRSTHFLPTVQTWPSPQFGQPRKQGVLVCFALLSCLCVHHILFFAAEASVSSPPPASPPEYLRFCVLLLRCVVCIPVNQFVHTLSSTN